MRRKRPDLIVPIRDRRRRRRILTLRNSGYAMLALTVLFIAITIRSEMRGGSPEGEYGRLYRREIPPPPAVKPVEVVQEAAPHVDDAISADPMLIQAAARSQWLSDGTATLEPVAAPPPMTLGRTREGRGRIAIVGDAGGVTTMAEVPQERPLLKGGIFRQQP